MALATPDGTPLFDVLLVSTDKNSVVDGIIFLILCSNAILAFLLLAWLAVDRFWGDNIDVKVVESRVKALETRLDVMVEIFAKHTTNIGRIFDPKVTDPV